MRDNSAQIDQFRRVSKTKQNKTLHNKAAVPDLQFVSKVFINISAKFNILRVFAKSADV